MEGDGTAAGTDRTLWWIYLLIAPLQIEIKGL